MCCASLFLRFALLRPIWRRPAADVMEEAGNIKAKAMVKAEANGANKRTMLHQGMILPLHRPVRSILKASRSQVTRRQVLKRSMFQPALVMAYSWRSTLSDVI